MKWTTPDDIRAQVQRLWDRGLLLATLAGGAPLFPRRLTLKAPDSRELSERFPEAQDWIGRLSRAAGSYRIEWRTRNHRTLGANRIPSAIWIDTLDNALDLIGQRKAAEPFAAQVEITRENRPEWVCWLAKRPLRALDLTEDWPRLLAIADWLQTHPRPGIYPRQMELPGVHSKFLETHRGVLTELLDLALSPEAIDAGGVGVAGFYRRYGFLEKPARVRFRILDPAIRLVGTEADQDITITRAAFSGLELPVSRVFITENETNFLAFPGVPGAMAIFGAGYGFDNLAAVPWLAHKEIHYWGDIDTHGFAILNQLRAFFPHAASLLMDRETLLTHRALWGIEEKPETGNLTRLTAAEFALYDGLRQNRWGDRVRLEQERIGFDVLRAGLRGLEGEG